MAQQGGADTLGKWLGLADGVALSCPVLKSGLLALERAGCQEVADLVDQLQEGCQLHLKLAML